MAANAFAGMYAPLDKRISINKDVIESPNLCDRFSSDDLTKIGDLVWNGYQRDEMSRIKWKQRMEAAMDLALQVQKDKNFPWPGCSNVVFPLVSIAALQFSARSYSNIIQGTDVVQYRMAAEDDSGEFLARSRRIGRHMSWQVLEQDSAWEEQTDRLLINLGIVGTCFKKSYFSPAAGHNVSEMVRAADLCMDYYAKSVEECARKTQLVPLYRNEIYERVMRGTFRNVLDESWYNGAPGSSNVSYMHSYREDNRQGVTPPQADEDTPFRALEQHRLLDLDQDGYAEPYVVTIEATSKKVLRIVARFDREEDVERQGDRAGGRIISIRSTEYFTKYSFIPSPDGGIYDVGFGILLGPLNEAVNSGINQLLDSGTMQNSIGGFLGRGAKIRGGVYTMAPWEWKRVDSTGDDLRKNLVPYPERQPSLVMFQLLGLLIQYVDRLAGTTDAMTGENPGQNTPAYNMREMVNQGMQVYNVIFKRVWRSMKAEFKKLHKLNANYLPMRQAFGDKEFILREDYLSNPDWVVPSADPNLVSNAERFQQAQALRQASRESPGYNVEEVEKNFLRAMRVNNINTFYPGPSKVPPPKDPRVTVQEMKMQEKQLDLKYRQWELVTKIRSEERKVQAEIKKLNAEVVKILSEAQTNEQELRLQAVQMTLESLTRQEELLNERVQTLLAAGSEEGGAEGSRPAGMGGMAGSSGDEGVSELPEGLGGGSEGTVVGGPLPEGND